MISISRGDACVAPTDPALKSRGCGCAVRCFPDRRVVGIEATDVIWGLGSWHCLSQQVPAGLINVG
nr:agmatine deiminase family protein [Chloroflexus aurantiacus]